MRIKLLTVALMAGTAVGCASNPPPPPMAPMADMTPAPVAPVASGPMTGMYTGTADAGTLPRGCAKMTKPVSVTVRPNNAFSLAGLRGMVGPDGAITSAGRGGSLSGSVTSAGMDVTATKGKCTYHYMLTHA